MAQRLRITIDFRGSSLSARKPSETTPLSKLSQGGPGAVRQVAIDNPVINSPFTEPARHFRFTDEAITNEVIDGRRSSSSFVAIARPRKKGQRQLVFDIEWTQDRIEENKLVNRIRARVKLWREGDCGPIGLALTRSSEGESGAHGAVRTVGTMTTRLDDQLSGEN